MSKKKDKISDEIKINLISFVQSNPILYDLSYAGFKYKSAKDKLWSRFAEVNNLSSAKTASDCWKNLKSQFNANHLKSNSTGSGAEEVKWKFYTSLTFLKSRESKQLTYQMGLQTAETSKAEDCIEKGVDVSNNGTVQVGKKGSENCGTSVGTSKGGASNSHIGFLNDEDFINCEVDDDLMMMDKYAALRDDDDVSTDSINLADQNLDLQKKLDDVKVKEKKENKKKQDYSNEIKQIVENDSKNAELTSKNIQLIEDQLNDHKNPNFLFCKQLVPSLNSFTDEDFLEDVKYEILGLIRNKKKEFRDLQNKDK